MTTVVGIDIGTTSAKICATIGDEIICALKQCYSVEKENENENENGVQNAQIIVKTSMELFENVKKVLESREPSKRIDEVWVCGQMHGIVLWNQESLTTDSPVTSSLYNWTYSPPDQSDFLSTLPEWSCGQVRPGFGLATLAYLYRSEPESLKKYNRCGTIMDLFLVTLLVLHSRETAVPMSHHNAHSWGYCSNECSWQADILPLLPHWIQLPIIVRDCRRVVSTLNGAKCHVASGDLQASVASLDVYEENTAYLILGTSAQLCCLVNPKEIPETLTESVVKLPYSEIKQLMAACSMNGGNALETVLKLHSNSPYSTQKLANLLKDLDRNAPPLPSDLRIDPIFIPERGLSKKPSVNGISPDTSDLQILEATHFGIIDNLFSMYPESLLKSLKISCLALVGAAQSARFKRHIEAIAGKDFKLIFPKTEISTPLGATRF
ncbi:unnamed protein product [Caenorhabditis sp. 36 PRJEB53466]|nr:unnamed protein product [Caenorhabditis sp. 36 PRJEB53466]